MPNTPTEIATKLLLHFDETTPDFRDSSIYSRPQKSATVGSIFASSDSKFGGRCYANSSGTNGYLQYGIGASIVWGNPWCVDFWIYPTEYPTSGTGAIIWRQGYSQYARPGIYLGSDGALRLQQTSVLNATSSEVMSGALALNQWTHIAVGRGLDNVTRAFVNGVLFATITSLDLNGEGYTESLLASVVGSNESPIPGLIGGTMFKGRLDELRLTVGACDYTSGFTPPTAPYADATLDVTATGVPLSLRVNAAVVPPLTTIKAVPAITRVRDVYFSGTGLIIGTVKRVGVPDNVPLARKVRLFDETSGVLVAETWSDATTGGYTFTNLNLDVRYTVIAYDHTHVYRAVVADNLTPEAA